MPWAFSQETPAHAWFLRPSLVRTREAVAGRPLRGQTAQTTEPTHANAGRSHSPRVGARVSPMRLTRRQHPCANANWHFPWSPTTSAGRI